MTRYRFHGHDYPAFGRYAAFGDGEDFSIGDLADSGQWADFDTGQSWSNPVDEVVVVGPQNPVNILPYDQALGPDIVEQPDQSWLTGPLDVAFPSLNFNPGAPTVASQIASGFQNALAKLTGKTPAGSSGGGSGGSLTLKPTTTTTPPKPATGIPPYAIWGATAAGIILLSAALSGRRHHRR
jgi:hypothetical protein